MNSKRITTIVLTLLVAVFAVGAASAQDASPRSPLPYDILLDDSFDSGTAYWQILNASGDKVKCAENFGHVSDCAFMFKSGVNEATKIKQVYKPTVTPDSVSQYIGFIAHVKPTRAGQQIKFTVNIKFKSGAPALKQSYVYTSVAASQNFQNVSFDTSLFNAADVKSIAVIAANQSTSGKIYVDGFYVGAYGIN